MSLEDAIAKGMQIEWDRAAAMMRSKGWLSLKEAEALRAELATEQERVHQLEIRLETAGEGEKWHASYLFEQELRQIAEERLNTAKHKSDEATWDRLLEDYHREYDRADAAEERAARYVRDMGLAHEKVLELEVALAAAEERAGSAEQLLERYGQNSECVHCGAPLRSDDTDKDHWRTCPCNPCRTALENTEHDRDVALERECGLRESLERMVQQYESEYDPEPAPQRPGWLVAALRPLR